MSKRASPNQHSWTGQIVGVFLVVAVILWFVQMRRAPMQLLERRDCQNAYATARTAADSVAVDARQPLDAHRTGKRTITCGELRKAGHL